MKKKIFRDITAGVAAFTLAGVMLLGGIFAVTLYDILLKNGISIMPCMTLYSTILVLAIYAIITILNKYKKYNDTFYKNVHELYIRICDCDGDEKEIEQFIKKFKIYNLEDIDNVAAMYYREIGW